MCQTKGKKIIIIGIDGGTFNIIDPLVESGKLQNFRKFYELGFRTVLESTVPPATVPAWPSFYTGKNPAKYGVFDFFKIVNNTRRIVSRLDIKSEALWDILGKYNMRSIVINVPTTYPPRISNGILASGMFTPSNGDYVYPSNYKEVFERVANGYKVNGNIGLTKLGELVKELKSVTEKQTKVFLELLKTQDWDFSMLMLRATDIIQHKAWDQQDCILEIYLQIDEFLGKLLKEYPNALKIIVSDHGFTEQLFTFHINAWLAKQGYIKLSKKAQVSADYEVSKLDGGESLITSDGQLSRFLALLGVHKRNLKRVLPSNLISFLKKRFPKLNRMIKFDLVESIDEAQTIAHGISMFTNELKFVCINKNLIKREKYEPLREEIISKLQALKCPFTGRKVIRKAFKKEEVYSGSFISDTPDILYLTAEGYNTSNNLRESKDVTKDVTSRGCHTIDGIFICHGKFVNNKAKAKKRFRIYDILPTVLFYFGLPIPDDIDGRVLKEIFSNQEHFQALRVKEKEKIVSIIEELSK